MRLRHTLGCQMLREPDEGPEYAASDAAALPNGSRLAEVGPGELSAELLRAGVLRDGFLLVRGLVDRDSAEAFAHQIDASVAAREQHPDGGPETDGYYEPFVPDPPFPAMTDERTWVGMTGGVMAADSPRLMFEMLEMFERSGLRRVIGDYLGEQPALSLQKCTLRKAEPEVAGEWHQDGAFMRDVRTLNVWLSLSDCGEDAPGLDIVPRRIDHLVPLGTHGALHELAVSPNVVAEEAGERGVVRPLFEPGDVMLFDDLFLHKTASDTAMTKPRYAVESWFFGPSGFPENYAPMAF